MTKRFCRDELHRICALFCSLLLATPLVAQQNLVTDPPQSAASLTLTAVYDQQESHNASRAEAADIAEPAHAQVARN
jgi:hypothetical protein